MLFSRTLLEKPLRLLHPRALPSGTSDFVAGIQDEWLAWVVTA